LRSDRGQSPVACVKACLDGDRGQSPVACVKACLDGDTVQSKLSDEDFKKIVDAIENALRTRMYTFDKHLNAEMSKFLLCLDDCKIGTKWSSRMASSEDDRKGIEMKNLELLNTIKKKRHFSGKEWNTHCTEDLTLDHYFRDRDSCFEYHPDPLVFGLKKDEPSILKALKDVALRAELEKHPQLCRDILAAYTRMYECASE
jgi:hypothetical protein